MITFKQFITEAKYVGNCVNSFDLESGDCVVRQLPYSDTSAFAVGEEEAKTISKDEFLSKANVPEDLKKWVDDKKTTFLHDEDNGVYMMYTKKDVHYFFI